MSDATLYVDEQTMRDTASTFDSAGHDVSGNRHIWFAKGP